MSFTRMMGVLDSKNYKKNYKKTKADDPDADIPLLIQEEKPKKASRPMTWVEEARQQRTMSTNNPSQPKKPAKKVVAQMGGAPLKGTKSSSTTKTNNEAHEIDPVSGADLTVMRWMNMYGSQYQFSLGITRPSNLGAGGLLVYQSPSSKK